MKQKPKIIVIGSGIVGASIAMSCLNLGADVVVLERDNLGGSASSKSFGWINASFAESTDYFKLRNAAVDKFRNLTKESKSLNTWTIDVNELNKTTFDLSVDNPHIEEEVLPDPKTILTEIQQLENESTLLISYLDKLINEN